VAVGDELLEGRTADTNSRRIQRALGRHAVQVEGIQVVPDTSAAIQRALDLTVPGDLVFVSGGLGSTPDDLTRDVVADWGGAALVEDPDLRKRLEDRWRRRGIRMRAGVLRQSQVPTGMDWLENPVGSAPGLVGALRDRVLVLLPGVPQELTGLLPLAVDWLAERGDLPAARTTLLWRTAQIAELALVGKLEDLPGRWPALAWAWWLTDWGVDVRLAADPQVPEAAEQLAAAESVVSERLGGLVYSREMTDLAEAVQRAAIATGQTVAVAESCTSGLIGGRLTDHDGASGFFRGGILSYADAVKRDLLGVPADLLATHGAVSREVAEAMAVGCRDRLGTDLALAVSGISGPGGGTEAKPVGTTWVALARGSVVASRCYRFPGNRERNRLLTVAAGLDTLRRSLEAGPDGSPWSEQDSWCRPAPGA